MSSVPLVSGQNNDISFKPSESGGPEEGLKKANLCNKTKQAVIQAIAFIPKKTIEWSMGYRLKSTVRIDSLSLSWTGPQKLKGIHIQHPQGEASVAQLQIDNSLPSLLCSSDRTFQAKNIVFSSPKLGGGKVSHVAGALSKDSMTLSKPLEIELEPKNGLNQALLKKVHPFFVEGAKLKTPIQVTISPEIFFSPGRQFSLENLTMSGTVNMGRIECQNGKLTTFLIDVLKSNPISGKKMDIHCAPVSFSLDRGALHTGRMDAMIDDSIHVCTWGSADLLKETVDMNLGIPADTLVKSFSYLRMLSPDYVLKIPLRGSIHKIHLEKRETAAAIASLVTTEALGQNFGGLVKRYLPAAPRLDVPPAERPFPWEHKVSSIAAAPNLHVLA